MNATSSRSHTIVELKFKQLFKNKAGSLMQRSSTINLVDLAGRLVIYLKLDWLLIILLFKENIFSNP
jgi:hypothetical protein